MNLRINEPVICITDFTHPYCFNFDEPTLQRRHGERDGVSNHPSLDCLLNRLIRRRSKNTSKVHITGLCEGNSSVIGDFPGNAEL